ncbi:MAG: protein-glutamate O-methyltransferase CheR [Burkholderiales bacterium]|nr:protein-glutamate O-methyltransferase CheR [Burkholderiales bacterium]MDE1928900.1 protein-glutamate O-methyltransferase CheR [Burkholderiales bacterium]MDE2159462.1 protein-glutamate O-methyltransferase CheR [Burkholderiales bacterium]MDE2501520.1 protein-glutamate O-methyltransferase CheR [Burkholderiales bacterium]
MPEFGDMDGATLRRVLQLVREHTGISMNASKRTMLQARLRPRLRRLGLAGWSEYLQRLGADDAELQPFIDAVTTHQTAFFRTPRVWRYLREVLLPAWAARAPPRPLRVWSAAASTGEEACTMAICCEELRRAHADLDYEIVASDIGVAALAHARRGLYEGPGVAAFRDAEPELFERHNALRASDRFELAAPLRRRIEYRRHNLLDDGPWRDHFDLVLLRNVLIYFNADATRRIVQRSAAALREQGVLVIGEAESLSSMDVPLRFLQPQIYARGAA